MSPHGAARSASIATRAARAAALPCPTPSIAATSASRPTAQTTASSPDWCSPAIGRPATDHSRTPARSAITTGVLAHDFERVAVAPLAHRDGGAAADFRVDVELVHQPPAARQPEPQAASGRVSLLEGALDVGDPGPLVTRDHDDRDTVVVHVSPDLHLARPGVDEDVAPDLRDRRRDEGRVSPGEAESAGQRAALPARDDDVGVGRD